jgi:hypothetical protein
MDLRKLFTAVSRERKKEPNPFEEPQDPSLKEKLINIDTQ